MFRRTIRAFTLIELLAVIAIIGVLSALLLPALSFAKFQAKSTACKSNLRQMSVALQLYTSTFDAYPPYASPIEGAPADTWYRWDMLLARLAAPNRYVVPFSPKGAQPPARLFLCPLLIGRPENLFNPAAPAWDSGYRYNSFGVASLSHGLGLGGTLLTHPTYTATKEGNVIAPAEMISLGDPLTRSVDTKLDGSYDPNTARFRPQPAGSANSIDDGDARNLTVYRNHRNRYNRAFTDGHVELEDFRKPFVGSDSYLARYNVDHQPHREAWLP